MAKPFVFVIGATGTIGSASVTALSSKYADKLEIRAGVRNLEKADKLKELAGVTVVEAEMGANEKLVETFKGVHALYIVTPGIENRVQVAAATAEAAKTAGVKYLVVVSVSTADVHEIIFGRQFGELEGKVKQLGVPYTFLRLPMFMENHFGMKGTIKGQSSIFSPVDPTKQIAAVAVGDAGKFAAAVLADPSKHINKTYDIVSDRYTHNDLTAAFSEALGREIKFVNVPYEATKQAIQAALQPWQVDGLMELFKLIDDGSPFANMNDHDLSMFTDITGDQPTNIKTWVNQVAGAFK